MVVLIKWYEKVTELNAMKLLRVSAAVINTTPLDWDGNRRRISGAIGAARSAGASILCLPEMCITGYGCEDAFHAPGLQQTALEVLRELLPETAGGVFVFFGACARLSWA